MKFRTTLVAFGLALVLGGWVYWHEVRGGRERAQERAAAASLLGIDAAEVSALRITHSGNIFELRKHGERWRLERPESAPCDPRVIGAFLDSLAGARREDQVGRGDLEKYGLRTPTAVVEITAGATTRRLTLGNINPLQTLVYVLVDDSQAVLLTSSTLLTYALTNAFGWRDKRMIDVDVAGISRLTIRTPRDGSRALQRGPTGMWVSEGETAWRADPSRLASALQALAHLEGIGIAAEHKAELPRFGLDNRRFGAQIETAAGQVVGDLVVGFEDGSGAYYGIVAEKPEVFRVDGNLVDLLVGLVRDPRDQRALPPFDPAAITRLRVHSTEDVFTLRRISSQDWKVEASQKVDSTFALATGAVDAMLANLAILEVSGYPDRQPPTSAYEPATVSIVLEANGRMVSGLELGTKDPHGLFTFARAPREPAVFLVSPAVLLHVPFDLERLKALETDAPTGTDRG